MQTFSVKKRPGEVGEFPNSVAELIAAIGAKNTEYHQLITTDDVKLEVKVVDCKYENLVDGGDFEFGRDIFLTVETKNGKKYITSLLMLSDDKNFDDYEIYENPVEFTAI